jgi:hypothetical protein
MASMFAFEEDWSNTSQPALEEKEWPRLGGAPTLKLKPSSGRLRGALQSPATSTLAAGGSLYASAGEGGRATIGTAKGGLALLLANSRSSSRAPSEAGDIAAERAAEKASSARGRKKKAKNSKGAKRGTNVSTAGLEKPDFLKPRTLKASPSTSSLREEFRLSEDHEYTWSFVKRRLGDAPASNSACSSPPRSSLSSLPNQAHPGDVLTFDGSDTPASSESGEPEEALVAYEVAIDEDYISKDVDSHPTSRAASPTRRKVTADDFEPLKCLGKGA